MTVPNAVELIEDGKLVNKKRNPFVERYKHLNEFRFSWLKNDVLQYFEHWLHSIENRPGTFSKEKRAKMFIARPSYEGLKITVHSTIELVQFILKAGVPYVLTGKFIQDS